MSNIVYAIKAPHQQANGSTIWLAVGTITLLGSKDHKQGLMRLNMWPGQTYQVFEKEDDNERS